MPRKPTCDCGKCVTCYFRNAKRRTRLKNKTPMKRTALKRSAKPIKAKRSKPRRVAVLRDPKYMAWLRETRACLVCVRTCGRTEAAHTKVNGTASKGPDPSCVPLGRGHHMELHRIGVKDFEAKYGIDLKREAEAHYLAYTAWREGRGL